MNSSADQTPLARKRRLLLAIRIVGLVLLAGAVAILWNNLPLLGAVAAAVVLLTATAFSLVERQYSRALEHALARTVGRQR